MGFLADSTLHNTEPEFAYSALAPHLADTSPPDCHHATANWADRLAGPGDDGDIPLAKACVICYTNHAFGDGVPRGMRGVVALAHVTVGTPFSFVRVAFNAYTTHSIAQFHASGWLRQRCPAKRQSFPALPSDKIVYASFYPGDFPSTDGSINRYHWYARCQN